MSKSLPYVIALAIAIAAVTLAFRDMAIDTPFYYDEADYMYAGTRGLIANFLDRPSLSLVEFVQSGLALSRDRSKSGDMSRLVRDRGDIMFYRHYHGPVYAYWIALCQMAGAGDEAGYRASGLILHALISVILFAMFRWVFPGLPMFSALLAALAYLLNRTALTAGIIITMHVLFPLFAALTLFFLGLFRRDLDRRYWYAATACLGLGLATVETSFVLLGAVLITLVTLYPRLSIKQMLGLTLRGAAVCAVAVLIVWPKGILQLGLLRGYGYLAYIAIFKKTFTPISPFALWKHKFSAYPYEFILPAVALAAGVLFYRKLSCREQAAPFLLYAALFIAVTMVVTAPFTYYHSSLLMATAVIIAAMAGELWNRSKPAGALAATAALASLIAMAVIYHRELLTTNIGVYEHRAPAIEHVKTAVTAKTYYVPFTLVPPLHYYAPQSKTIAYDAGWSAETLAQALSAPGEPKELLCAASVCGDVRGKLPVGRVLEVKVADADHDIGEPFYALTIDPGPAQ